MTFFLAPQRAASLPSTQACQHRFDLVWVAAPERQEWCRPYLLARPRLVSSNEMHQLKLTFDQLVMIRKSLQAVQTLAVLPRRDELLDDTIEVVDQALTDAVRIPLHTE
jgi:hypothetical protein